MTILNKANNRQELSIKEMLTVNEFNRLHEYMHDYREGLSYNTEFCKGNFIDTYKYKSYSFELEQEQKKCGEPASRKAKNDAIDEIKKIFPDNWFFNLYSEGYYIDTDKLEKDVANKILWNFNFDALYKSNNTFVICDIYSCDKEDIENFIHRVKKAKNLSDNETNFNFDKGSEIEFKEQLCSDALLKENTKYRVNMLMKYTAENGLYFSLYDFTEKTEELEKAKNTVKNTEQIEKKSNPIFKIVLFILIFFSLWAFLDTL